MSFKLGQRRKPELLYSFFIEVSKKYSQVKTDNKNLIQVNNPRAWTYSLYSRQKIIYCNSDLNFILDSPTFSKPEDLYSSSSLYLSQLHFVYLSR